jgi:hypothetical protein
MALPFICDTCGNLSLIADPFGLSGPNIKVASLQIKDVTMLQTCPQCGGDGHIADGTYEIAHGVTRALSLLNVEDLRRLQAVLIASRDSGATAGDTAQRIAEAVPNASFLAGLLSEKGILGITLLAIITFGLLQHFDSSGKPDPLTPKEVAKIAAAAVKDAEKDNAWTPNKEQPGFTVPKRRAPCWCGSGKRFKNCHGRKPR